MSSPTQHPAELETSDGYELWQATADTLVTCFHADAKYGSEQRRVEAAIIELVTGQLWNELGPSAAWDAFDVQRWCDVTLVLDDGYRTRVRTTLSRFYAFLAQAGHVKRIAAERIEQEIEQALGATPASTPHHSMTRGLAEPTENGVVAPLGVIRRA